ncbi:hypothetical protein EMPS_02929 [Entomortierella parvispora]|uniref:F-box domain-containing protein n=1 Tax=Entomortierella parvispora TaxID=205924 RepID=A0A9P3H5X5_9FUNG|nr:hypothetical protein EMPS_02929 [Entomortierella parvispora]
MDLLEIELNVGFFLQPQDLACCVRVCKGWYQAFTPSLYCAITTTEDPSMMIMPTVSVLRKHARHIRQLRVHLSGPYLTMLRSHCTNLKRLDVVIRHMDKTSPDGVLALIRANPRIASMKVAGNLTLMPTLMMRGLSKISHNITGLRLSELGLTSESLERLLDTAEQLQVLELDITFHELQNPDWERWPSFPHLKHLVLSVTGSELNLANQLMWIQRCPNLEALRWNIGSTVMGSRSSVSSAKERRLPTKAICDVFKQKKLPKLHSLDLQIMNISHTDADVEAILNACPPLKKFRAATCSIHYSGFRALERHFGTLEDLDVAGCDEFSSPMVQKVLSSCPRLKRLRANVLAACDVVSGFGADEVRAFVAAKDRKIAEKTPGGIPNGKPLPPPAAAAAPPKPWVCKGLETLIVCITGADAPMWNEQVLAQIGKMSQLRELEVGVHPGCWEQVLSQKDNRGLDLRLKRGLRYLNSLPFLEKLTYYKIPQRMTSMDVRFMARTWPHLCEITWTLHTDEAKAAELRPSF